jgi:hypothetical protein
MTGAAFADGFMVAGALWQGETYACGDHPVGCYIGPYNALVLSANMVILEGVK